MLKLLSLSGLIVLAAVAGISPVFAEGTIRGTVSDSVVNEPLVGANVYLVGTAIGAVTDREGAFRIPRVSQGSYLLRVSYLGYVTREMRVDIGGGDTTIVLRTQLVPEVLEGEEVVVTGQARGQIAAMNQQISSNTIVNVVSEEKIKELPDANAAEAIGHLPGVSILRSGGEANKVILRGMSDKFTSITVDGVRIAATDANERGVDLSTISQGSLAGIELFKALTPDKDAEAIAGSVNLVTRKAPSERLLRAESKGAYGRMNRTFGQYDFSLRYGERFLDDLLGVQVVGNLESRDRSNEVVRTGYFVTERVDDYHINDFGLEYTDEQRGRKGLSLLLDLNTPDSGSIRINNVYNRTDRDYTLYKRSYAIDNNYPLYSARDIEQDIRTFNSSVRGDNHLLGLDVGWGLSFAQSLTDNPYDFELLFHEPSSDTAHSGMKSSPYLKSSPELLIPEAWNNFDAAMLDTAYFRYEKNLDKQKTATLDLERGIVLSEGISARLKAGGRYGIRNRFREANSVGGAYWLSRWSKTERLPDGTLRQKSLGGTRFASMLDQTDAVVSMRYFLDFPPTNRDVYDRYALYPLINRDAVRLWYELNRYGASGATNEYQHNVDDDGDFYDITERIAAGYLMTTVNAGQWMTFIGGARVETEDNDYRARFSRGFVERFPNSGGGILDTTTHHSETVWLPNFQATVRPTDFMNVRLAAYRALARPDFNSRLDKFLALKGNTSTMTVGNPNLMAAKAWNFEINTSFFGANIGLISLSAFYKDIKDMYHLYNGVQTKGTKLTDSLGILWRNPFVDTSFVYNFTYPFNSRRPTKVWGIEFEHQANLTFLPGVLQNFVLNYNFSLVRSETFQVLYDTRWDTLIIPSEFGDVKIPYAVVNIFEAKTRLENQPEFFANVALGYDIGGFSSRLSLFHQGEYTSTFTARGRGDRVVKSYSRLDLSVKYKVTDNISLLLNLNNLTNTEEPISNVYTGPGWDLPVSSQKYGLSGDFGVRVEW